MSYEFFKAGAALVTGTARTCLPATAAIAAISLAARWLNHGVDNGFTELAGIDATLVGMSYVMAARLSPQWIGADMAKVEEAYASGAYDVPVLPGVNLEFVIFEFPALVMAAGIALLPAGAVLFAVRG